MREPFLNAVYSKASMQRRYEVWFLRLGLADGSGAWWFRYLLLNPGREGCQGHLRGLPAEALAKAGQPVQVWATWFPRGGVPKSFIQGFPLQRLSLSPRGASPFRFEVGANRIGEDSCRGRLEADGHVIAWDLRYQSTFGATLSDFGWIGFSRTPHSDAVFSGEIHFDGRRFAGELLGHGLQGHNCGFRHRHLWNWTHCVFPVGGGWSSFEALEYELPLGWRYRKAQLWRRGRLYLFRKLKEAQRDRENLVWSFQCAGEAEGSSVEALLDGGGGGLHRLPYLKTDCSGTFEVSNNSLARATVRFLRPGRPTEEFSTDGGAVLEMAG